jgi:hypothetical protein
VRAPHTLSRTKIASRFPETRIVRRLQQEGGNAREKNGLAHALRSEFPDVARDLAAAHRKTCQHEIEQFEMRHQFAQVLGEGVVVVAAGGLAGSAESTAIVGDDAVAGGQKNWNLLFLGCPAEWISVDQNHRVARAVVLIVNIDVS